MGAINIWLLTEPWKGSDFPARLYLKTTPNEFAIRNSQFEILPGQFSTLGPIRRSAQQKAVLGPPLCAV